MSFQQPQQGAQFGVPHEVQQSEEDVYWRLVSITGRPSHTLTKLKTIAQDPGEYRDIVSFYQVEPGDISNLFSSQLFQWEDFLWQ